MSLWQTILFSGETYCTYPYYCDLDSHILIDDFISQSNIFKGTLLSSKKYRKGIWLY